MNPLVPVLAELLGDALVLLAEKPEAVAAARKLAGHAEPAPAVDEPDALLNKSQLGKKFAVSVATIDRLTREGLPIAAHVGDARRYDLEACKAWLAARGPKPTRSKPKSDDVDIDDVIVANGMRVR